MKKSPEEIKFEEYRKYLQYECLRLASYIYLYKHIEEKRADKLDEMNLASGFFQTTIDALFSAIVICTDKLFCKKSQRGTHDFLLFVAKNISISIGSIPRFSRSSLL